MNSQFPNNSPLHRLRFVFNKVAVLIVALILTTGIILQGNFLEGLLKLLGVGASGVQTITLSSVEDWLGGNDAKWLAPFETGANVATFEATIAALEFTGQPADPGEANGFVMPLWSGAESADIAVTEARYLSPVIDLGEGNPILQTLSGLDYQPADTEIIYRYRMASSQAMLDVASFQIAEMQAIDQVETHVMRAATLEIPAPRYLQLQIGFRGFTAITRPMLAELSLAYLLEEESVTPPDADELVPNLTETQLARTITVDYNELSIPKRSSEGSVRINTAADGRLIAQLKGLDLSKLENLTLENLELNQGEQYVLVLETPDFDNKVLYFAASFLPEDDYSFTFGALSRTTSSASPADLNGDGIVNSLDYAKFLSLWEEGQNLKAPTTAIDN